MTVRWKPLLILSGLFFVVALVGVIAMAYTLVPRSAEGVLSRPGPPSPRVRFDDAEIYFKQALQFDAKNASIHEEFANLYRDWARTAPADRQETIQAERLDHLVKAVKYDKNARGPQIQLLEAPWHRTTPPNRSTGPERCSRSIPTMPRPTTSWPSRSSRRGRPTSPRSSGTSRRSTRRRRPAIRRALVRARVAAGHGR